MTSKYHTRQGYERELKRLYKISGHIIPNMEHWSDYKLLWSYSMELVRQDCMPFTPEELEMELH